jgi:hypothetical protein
MSSADGGIWQRRPSAKTNIHVQGRSWLMDMVVLQKD